MTEEFLLRPLTQEQIDEWRQSIKYRVEFRHYGPDKRVTVKGTFTDKADASFYMNHIERDYEEGGCLWLVEVYPNGGEHDVYGYT